MDILVTFCIGFLLGALIVGGITHSNVDEWWRIETAHRGHSHFYIDQNMERQWNWIESKP